MRLFSGEVCKPDAHITNSHTAEGLMERSGVTQGWPIAATVHISW